MSAPVISILNASNNRPITRWNGGRWRHFVSRTQRWERAPRLFVLNYIEVARCGSGDVTLELDGRMVGVRAYVTVSWGDS